MLSILKHNRAAQLTAMLVVCVVLSYFNVITPVDATYAGVMFAGVGDLDLKSINDLIDKQGHAFEEFKKANDNRLKAVESKGYAPADTVEKVDKINTELTTLSAEIRELMKKSKRLNVGDGELSQDQQEHKSSFSNYFRKGIYDAELRALEKKAVNTASDPDGGFLFPTEMSDVIDRVVVDTVAMRNIASVLPIGSSSYKKPVVTNGATSGWLGEKQTYTETGTPSISMLEFKVGKLFAYPYATEESLEDGALDIANWLDVEVSLSFVEKEGEAFISSTGINSPRGLLTYDTVANANHAWGKIGYVASGASGAFHTDEGDALIKLVHSLKRSYRTNARWLMNDLTMEAARKIKNANDDYIWRQGLEAGVPDSLLGYPVEIDDNMPDIAANSLSIAFGDFKRGYLIVDRRGIVLKRDEISVPGYTKFIISKRVGGGVQNFEAIKLMKFAAS